MNQEEFKAYITQGFNRIPLMREVLADLDTPLSTFLKLADGPYSYLFESVQGGEKWGRYSIIGLPCTRIVRVSGYDITIIQDGKIEKTLTVDDPLDWIEKFQLEYKVPEIEGLPKFNGGLVGYFGYDTIRYIEPRLKTCPNPDQLELPDILLMVSDELVVHDNLSGKLYIIVHADENGFEEAQVRLDWLTNQLDSHIVHPAKSKSVDVNEEDFISGFSQQGFEDAVLKAKEYIKDGDAMQIVLSQRLSIPFSARPIDLYRALRGLNPSPYMFYLDLGDFHVAGSSPEILTRLEDGDVTVRPIAGTRPRGKTAREDKLLEFELLADPKELAEHLMLIDLGRNDVGRIAKIGSVQLTENMLIERYSHVMHIVSNVVGKLKVGLSAMDVLRATFPAGTVSGAPKIRAMEIIDELEPVKRGVMPVQ